MAASGELQDYGASRRESLEGGEVTLICLPCGHWYSCCPSAPGSGIGPGTGSSAAFASGPSARLGGDTGCSGACRPEQSTPGSPERWPVQPADQHRIRDLGAAAAVGYSESAIKARRGSREATQRALQSRDNSVQQATKLQHHHGVSG